jgi:hypothetical protein
MSPDGTQLTRAILIERWFQSVAAFDRPSCDSRISCKSDRIGVGTTGLTPESSQPDRRKIGAQRAAV